MFQFRTANGMKVNAIISHFTTFTFFTISELIRPFPINPDRYMKMSMKPEAGKTSV